VEYFVTKTFQTEKEGLSDGSTANFTLWSRVANQEDPGPKADGEMRMIRSICGDTKLNRIRNVVIKERVGVVPLEEKLRETKLKWFEHVKR